MTGVRAAQVVMDIRPYRIGLLERIAGRADVDLVMYAGRPAPGQGAPETAPDVAVPVKPVRNIFWPHDPVKILWQRGALAVLRSDAEVVVCQEVISSLTVWTLRLLHRPFGKKLVLQGFFYRHPTGRAASLKTAIRRFLRSSATSLISYTEQGKAELVGDGVDPSRVFVNGNTLDTASLMRLAREVTETDKVEMRSRLDIPQGVRVVAFVGRLRAVKKVEVAIDAVRQMAGAGTGEVMLVVVGDGPESERLRRHAEGAPVRFYGQTYDDAELARVLSIADLLVLPGSVGLTCVHGFANALPCLTTSDGAVFQTPEYAYVRDGTNGTILPRPDPSLYAAEIERLLEDDQRRAKLREGAEETARELDMDKMADAFASALIFARDDPGTVGKG